jgi:selenocysteine-specific elongation factor
MKRIIIGTAGHIDHGKSSLVRALTGVDPDRLKEEKERGVTIDIGFADLTVGDVHFGLVDVPGHERFIKNMLAGAHGVDLVLLVIAADEGLMPQTREHFDICRLLEVKTGLIVLTKIDAADAELVEMVEAEAIDYVKGSFLESAPILRVSSRTGEGIEQLKAALLKIASKAIERDDRAVARLPLDRAFTVKGFGVVVTGTLIAGQIEIGDELEILPSSELRARVRSIEVHGKSVTVARAGERTAINLQGVDLAQIARGQAVAPFGRLVVSSMFDVDFQLLASSPKPLRSRARVHLHLGTAQVMARIVLLGDQEAAPGARRLAQLRLESPVLAMPGDHFILRGFSPAMTIGGGLILDPLPAKHRLRDSAEAVARLQTLAAAAETDRIPLFVEMAGESGMTQAEIAMRSGSTDEMIKQASEAAVRARRLVDVGRNLQRLVARPVFERLARDARIKLEQFHKQTPLEAGMKLEELRERVFGQLSPEIFRAALSYLAERNEVVVEKDLARLARHQVALSQQEQAAKVQLAEFYDRADLNTVSLDEALAASVAQLGVDKSRLQRLGQMLISSGELVRVNDLIFHRRALDRLKNTLQKFKSEQGTKIDVSSFKDLTGVSRKYAIPLLEYLDRQRVTRRQGDAREIL